MTTDRQLLQSLRERMTYEPAHTPEEMIELTSDPILREDALAEGWADVWSIIDTHLKETT
jgi:hypothetical protein